MDSERVTGLCGSLISKFEKSTELKSELGFVKVIDVFSVRTDGSCFFHKNLWLEMMIRLAGSQRFISFFRQSKAMNHRPTHLRYTKPTAIMGDSPICYRDLLPSTVGKLIFQGHVVSPVKASTLHEANHPTLPHIGVPLRWLLPFLSGWCNHNLKDFLPGRSQARQRHGFCAGLSA